MPCIINHMQSTHRPFLAEGALTACVSHTWITPPFFQNTFPKHTFFISGIHPTPFKSGWIPFLINASPLSTIVSYSLFRLWFILYSFAKDTFIIFICISFNCYIYFVICYRNLFTKKVHIVMIHCMKVFFCLHRW